MEDVDALKRESPGAGKVKYRLKHATVYVSPGGFHFTDYLGPVEKIAPQIEGAALTEADRRNIENGLESNPTRFTNQVNLVAKYAILEGAEILDVGCGGGRFLSLVQGEGAHVSGIELSDGRAQYARTQYGLRVCKHPVESAFWQQGYRGHFDVRNPGGDSERRAGGRGTEEVSRDLVSVRILPERAIGIGQGGSFRPAFGARGAGGVQDFQQDCGGGSESLNRTLAEWWVGSEALGPPWLRPPARPRNGP
jgi:hypothetical protein